MSKKLISLLLSASILLSSGITLSAYAAPAAAEPENEVTITMEGRDDADATPTPEVEEEEETVTEETEQEIEEEQQGSDESDPAGSSGASGGLGFQSGAAGVSRFPDCQGHWAEQTIIDCTEKQYINGYDDGNFHPDDPVTASEFSKMYSAWNNKFFFVTFGHWAMPYIRSLVIDGVFEFGDFDDYDSYMTREDCAKAIVRSLKGEYFPANLDQFKELIPDFDQVDPKYGEYVLKSYISGIMTGYDDGSYDPKGYVTRAEILTLIDRAMNESLRVVPESAAANMGAPETQTYYTAAVHVRKSTSANSMQYRLYGKNAQYMTEDDSASGLKLFNEFQGAQGFAFLMRYDLTDILKREGELTSLKLIIKRDSNGDMPLGLFWYEHKISDLDWNDNSYMQNVNNSAVAGDNKAGYNAVCDNISAILPTWNDIEHAVPQEEKTQPFVQAELVNNQYTFDLDLNELKAHMNENNIVEFFSTSVNYDRYGMEKDNKPRCYTAGEKAPQLYAKFNTGAPDSGTIKLMPEDAEFMGGMLNLEDKGDFVNIANFTKDQAIVYNFKAKSAGTYKLTVNYSANQGSGGGTATIKVNDTAVDHVFAQTGSWTAFNYEDLGTFELKEGENTLTISDKLIPNTYLINIIDVIFEKID